VAPGALAPEFLDELMNRGRIYGYRFRPVGAIKGRPINEYRGSCIEGKAFQVMVDNNLDFDVALYPYELVTYGETGQVCQNWMQYRLIQRYLEELTREQTLVMASGHPLGLFASSPEAPRVIITNALMVGCFDDPENWHRAMALGVANYGQMTRAAGCTSGPRDRPRHLQHDPERRPGQARHPPDQDLSGRLFVSSGLGA
jgi:urocanate hydratase